MEAVTICIASLPERKFLNTAMESLLKQPELHQIIVSLNNYTDDDYGELLQHEKVVYFRTNNEKGCSEKLRFLSLVKTKYVGFIDDDFTVGNNYLKGLLLGLERHPNSIVSYHGRILGEKPLISYYKNSKTVHCRTELLEDKSVDVVGSGVCLFEKDRMKGCESLYDKVTHPNMTDIYLSGLAKANDIGRWVIRHNAKMITAKEYDVKDNYIFDSHRNNCQPQTEFVNKYL